MVQSKNVFRVLLSIVIVGCIFLGVGQQELTGADKVTLKYVSWMAKGEDKPLLKAFMQENPDIRVEDEILEGSRYAELLKTRLLSGDIPDVMLIMYKDFPQYVREGYLADLSGQPGMELQQGIPSVNNAFTVDGGVYGFSVNGGINEHPIWYNKKIFDSLGIAEPKTVEEFLEACQKIKEAGIEPIAFGGKDLWPYRWAQYWGFTSQMDVAMQKAKTKDIWEALYKGVPISTMFKDTLEFWAQLVEKGYVSKASVSMTWPESSQYFVDGNCAIFPQGPWVAGLTEVTNADPEKFELGVFLFPAKEVDGKRYLSGSFDRCLALSAATKFPEAAFKLFNYFVSEPVLKEYLSPQTLTSLLPIQLDLPPTIQKLMGDASAAVYELVILTFQQAPGLEGELNKTFQNIQAGSTVQEELELLDAFYAEHKGDIKL